MTSFNGIDIARCLVTVKVLNSYLNLKYEVRGDLMESNYIEIESVTGGVEKLIKQDMKFKTGNFVWRVKFTAPLNPSTVNNMNLYVTTTNEAPLKTAIRYNAENNYIEIQPLEPYAKNESYILNISKNVESKGGQKLKNNIRLKFKI
jgi:hypothetical protein